MPADPPGPALRSPPRRLPRAVVGAAQAKVLAAALAMVALIEIGPGAAHAARPQEAPTAMVPGKNCLGEGRRKLVLEHSVLGSVNPLGLENQLRVWLCNPLVRDRGLLFDYSAFEVGLSNYISPTHIHGGAFAWLTPVSPLLLRAELTGVFIWPIPISGAGYIPLEGYRDFTPEALAPLEGSPKAARSASGLRAALGATLQLALPIAGRLGVVIVNVFTSEYWKMGDAPFYYNTRRDVVLKGTGDWLISNLGVALLDISLTASHHLRVGVADDFVYVPASGYRANTLSGMLAWYVQKVGHLARDFQMFVRLGGYTDHAYRTTYGVALSAGLDIYYDVSSRR